MLLFLLSLTVSVAAHADEAPKNVLELFREFVSHDKAYSYLDDPLSPVEFPVKDLHHGFLTAQPPQAEGTLTFVLYRGNARDLLVKESGDCGPGCTYSYEAVTFRKGKFERKGALSGYYPLAQLRKATRKLLPGRTKMPKAKDWPEEKDFRFALPREGRDTRVYVLTSDFGPANDRRYYDVGVLSWDHEAFKFSFRAGKAAKDLGELDLY